LGSSTITWHVALAVSPVGASGNGAVVVVVDGAAVVEVFVVVVVVEFVVVEVLVVVVVAAVPEPPDLLPELPGEAPELPDEAPELPDEAPELPDEAPELPDEVVVLPLAEPEPVAVDSFGAVPLPDEPLPLSDEPAGPWATPAIVVEEVVGVAWANGVSAVRPRIPIPASVPAITECPVTDPTRAAAPTARVDQSEPNQENGATSRSRQMDTARNARTASGSNCVPAHLASS
jgi:hypothetical protein